MIKNVLERIGGIENYGIISILLFFACFLAALFWAFTRKPDYRSTMKRLPLEEDSDEATFDPNPNPHSKP